MLRTDLAPPLAPQKLDHPLARRTIHGVDLVDPWSWLRERDDPEVLGVLEAENAYAEGVLAPTAELQETLYREMVARIEEDEVTVPVRLEGYWYYQRRIQGAQYEVHCRRLDTGALPDLEAPDLETLDRSSEPREEQAEGAEEVLLDLNALAEEMGVSYLKVGALAPGPGAQRLAYSLDTRGDELYALRVLDLETGTHWPETLEGTARTAAWCNDGQALYYVTRDHAHRPYRVWRHRLGHDQADDELLWQEDDERFFVAIRRSRSRRFVFLLLGSHLTSEVRILDADDPYAVFEPLTGRRHGVEFEVDHHQPADGGPGRFFLLTNLDAPEFRLLEAPADDPAEAHWRDFVAHDPRVHLAKVRALRDHLIVGRRLEGLPTIRVYDLRDDTRRHHDVPFDEAAYDVEIGNHPEADTGLLRLSYTSPITPKTVLDYDLAARRKIVRKTEVVHGYDRDLYVTERLHAEAPDGVEIPVDIVHRRDRDAPGPLLLYGYGAYGNSTEARFHRNVLNLLDRGWAFAIAHVRGGSEMGKNWYDAGKLEHKENTFRDFVAAAEMLVAEGTTTPRQLAIRGGSAGGLLVGAVLNLRPDLLHAAIADVPFVDALHTMLDPTIPLTVIEYEEWGNPEADPDAFARIRGYAPYENVRAASYPHLLITAGLNDPRVQYWEPAKWTQRLRTTAHGGVVVCRVDLAAGHGGASGRYDSLRQEAFRQAFLLAAMETERTASD